MATPPLTALREALVKRLRTDATLTALLGGSGASGTRIYRRLRKAKMEPRTITYLDFGVRPDWAVPLRDRTVQIDVWDTDPVRAAEIADRVETLLDGQPFGVLPNGEMSVQYLGLTRDGDVVADDGDLFRATSEYRVLAYRL